MAKEWGRSGGTRSGPPILEGYLEDRKGGTGCSMSSSLRA